MIRSGQSLLANTLSIIKLGRGKQGSTAGPPPTYQYANCWTDWRRGQADESELLSMFADDPDSPFSIHRFVQRGAESCGKYPGEWFGPSATARCIQWVYLVQPASEC